MIPIVCYDCGKYVGYVYNPHVQASVMELDGKFIRCHDCYCKFEMLRKDIHHSGWKDFPQEKVLGNCTTKDGERK